jgi:hypothetical protein
MLYIIITWEVCGWEPGTLVSPLRSTGPVDFSQNTLVIDNDAGIDIRRINTRWTCREGCSRGILQVAHVA